MRCFQLVSEGAARSKIARLTKDRLIEKVDEVKVNRGYKAIYCETGMAML